MAGTVGRIGSWVPLWATACLALSLTAAAAPLEKVLEDAPGRLVLELSVPSPSLYPAGAAPGMKVACAGCQQSGRPGAPDLPVHRFDVLSGPTPPTVTFRILESETRSVPEGIAPYPRTPTPSTAEYRPDPELYRQAGALAARSFEVRYLRGAPVRALEVPLSLWSENARTLTLIKRMQVQVDFAGVLARPSALKLEGNYRREVRNPVGGAYLYASPQPRARSLAKSAAARETLGGRFVKIRIGDKAVESFGEDRMYSVSFAELSKIVAGGELNGVRVPNLRVFTGINDTLPRKMDSAGPVAGRLREIPIQVVDKNGNGTFDGEDSVRFFAHGTSIWKRLPAPASRIRFEFSADPYSFENGYFLDFAGSEPGLRLSESASPPATGSPLTNSYAYLRAEKDAQTAACDPSSHKDEETGFDWFWHWKGRCENRSDTTVTLTRANLSSEETATLPNYLRDGDGDSLLVGFYTYGSHSDSIFTAYFGGKGDTLEHVRDTGSPGTWFAWTGPLPAPPAFQLDNLEWRGHERRFEGYTVCYRRNHVLSADPLWIFPPETGAPVSYRVQGGAGASCLRVEDGVATRLLILDGQGVFTDSLAPDSDARYFVFRNTSPIPAGAMEADGLAAANTALRDLSTGDGTHPEYLIVTARPLLEQALALRDYRNSSKRALRLKTEVVLVEDIFRRYSGGRMSVPAIRDFLRYAYEGWGDRAKSGRLKYVVLFGDGNYDYRSIRASLMKAPPPNLIPPHEFINDDGLREEVASDDFYAMLDPGDQGYAGAMLDVALGRVPVQTAGEAADYLKKIADYENPALGGEWRGRIVMAADDNIQRGQPNGTDIDPISQGHTTVSDLMGQLIADNEKGVTVDKVYLLDYPMNSAYHKPEAAQDLLTLINRGTLMINYVGHGASNQWADEVLLQTNDAISRMRNEGRTPMVNAFSCTVGRFESLTSEGMSEQFVKQKGVGAIGAISATRESFPDPNIDLANAFYKLAFPPDSSGQVVTAGEALRQAKNSAETNSNDLNDLKYHLLGEPVLLLRKPQLKVALTQVMDTIQALDCNTIKGRVTGGNGAGMVNVKVVAGSVHKIYKAEGTSPQAVDKRGNILFERTFPYKDGGFETEYFIPKQIAFGDSTAQVQVFAWDTTVEMEGGNAKRNLRIKGTAQSACASDADGKGPRIRITGCQAKETSDLDFPDRVRLSLPYCMQIYVQDDKGGVLSAEGPDEGTTIEIPGVLDPFHPLPGIDELNLKSYQFSLDKKTIRPGTHLLKVSARDGYGNISQRRMQMDLTLDSSITAVTAYNFPNPMKRAGTTFHFATVLPSADLEFGDPNAGKDRLEYEIRVFNQGGNLVRVFANAVSGETGWDGRDDWGNLLANGVYFYKVTARQVLTDLNARPDYRTVSSKRNVLVISR
ncbi:MAG TPA: C25 family cysteine peptidase [Fibrobacteria bacterium]|nr:C25 family cysteine peptidase [Fibrobacteria bacterium]